MNGQISLNALHHWVSQYLQRSSVCVLGCCFNILAGSLQGCFSLCFLFLQSLKNIQRIGLSQIFCGHAHSPMHVNDLLDSQEYIGTFQRPYGYLISQHFFLSFLVSALFAPTLSLPQAAAMLNICCWLFLTNALGKSLFTLTVFWYMSNIDKPRE